MAVAFRSDAEVTNGTAGTSVTVAKPASIVDTGDNPDRDHLIAIIAAAGAPSITPPADWNLVDTIASGSAVTMWVYEKLAAAEGASWTWTLGSSLRNWGWVGAYTGVDPDDPVYGSQDTATLTASVSLSSGDQVPPAGVYIAAAAATRTASGSATTWTVADNFDDLTVNERADLSTNAGAGTDISGVVADATWATFYEGTLSATATASQNQTAGVAEFIALRPYFVPYTGDVAGTGLVIEAAFDVDPDSDSTDWTWTDLTADGHEPGRVTMRHGRANRATVADPSELRFTLLNLAGKYTAPTGTYAAKMIRNLPLRIRLNGFGTSVGGLGYHRGTFFLASMTPRWDASTNFAVVDIVASGRLRRIQQRDEPVHSAAYTAIQRMPSSSGYTAPVAHWPCEDESGSTKAASAVAGVAAAIVSNVEFGAGAGPTGSAPLMVMSASTTFDAPVPAYPATGTWTVMFATMVPDETGVETGLLAWRTTGTAALWRVSIAPGAPSALHLRVYNTAGAQILDTSVSVTESTFYTFPQFIRLEATQDGTGVDYELSYESADDGSGLTGTLAANTSGNVTTFTIGAQPGLADIVMGHIALHTQPGANGLFTTTAVLDANAGEWPWARFGRLCQEQNIPYINRASDNQDLEMGPQQAASFMQLIREAETVEGCVIHDSGGISNFGLLSFPARDDRENIDAALTLDMAQSQVAQPFTPILDDQDIVNDVEVSRVGGSSARVEDDASIARDGRYRQQVTVNTEDDLYLADLAGWRVNLGTVAGMRFPSVSWNMRHPNSVGLAESWVAMTLFQRLDILNPPSQYPPDDIRTILEGHTETISADTWTVTANLSPYDPNHVFVLADTSDTDEWLGRATGDPDCALRTAVDADDTALVFDPNAFRWTQYAGMVLTGAEGYAFAADAAALDITGDIDLRADITLTSWNPGTYQSIVAKYHTGGTKSYDLGVNTTGLLSIFWSNDGTADLNADSTTSPTPGPGGRLAIRATLDVNNGAAGKTATFYTAPTMAGPWTQLGSAVTTAGTTSIFSSTAILEIGSDESGAFDRATGTIHSAQVRSGIDGTIVANPDFSAQAIGTTAFVDSAGVAWTLTGAAAIDSDFPLDIRLGGEVVTLSGISTTAATYVAAGAMSTANNAAVTPALYAGATANDLICVVARIRAASAGTLTTPAGYTRVPLGTWTEADEMQLYVKVHTGSESNPTVTPTGGSAGDTVSAVTFGLRNMPITLDDLADLVVASQTLTNSSAQNITYPGLVPKRDGAPIDGCVVLLFGGKDDDWTSVAAVSGSTEALDSSSSTGNDQGLVIDYVIQTTATSIGSGSFTVTGGASAVSSAAIVALAGGYQTGTASARSVNGVVKSHAVGTVIEVEDPGVLSM